MGNFILVMGLSGSGKSYWTNNVADDEGMVILDLTRLKCAILLVK